MHIFYNQIVIIARAYCLLKLNPNRIIIHNSKKTCVGVKVHQYNFRSDDGLVDDPKLVYVNCRWCFSDIAIWPNLRLALSICRHKMMTKWPHTTWKRTTLCCILHTSVLEVNNFHPHFAMYERKLFTSKISVRKSTWRCPFSRCVWPYFVIILCLQINRANHRFGQMGSISN